jgi:hypothetical protein
MVSKRRTSLAPAPGMDRLLRRDRRARVRRRRRLQGRSHGNDVWTGPMPDRHERHRRNRDASRPGPGPSERPLLHGFTTDRNRRQADRLEGRLRSEAPDRPRSRRARALVHGDPLGTTHARCATALRQSGPRARAEAIGTSHESLKTFPGGAVGFSGRTVTTLAQHLADYSSSGSNRGRGFPLQFT